MQPQPIIIQDTGCYESTPGEFKTIKLWKTHGFLCLMFVVFSILAIINIRTILFSSAGTHADPNDQDAIGFYRISIGNLSMPSLDIYEMMKW